MSILRCKGGGEREKVLHTKFNEVLMKTCNNWHGACSSGLDHTSKAVILWEKGRGGRGQDRRKEERKVRARQRRTHCNTAYTHAHVMYKKGERELHQVQLGCLALSLMYSQGCDHVHCTCCAVDMHIHHPPPPRPAAQATEATHAGRVDCKNSPKQALT